MHRIIVMGKGGLAVRACEWFTENPAWGLVGIVPVHPEPDWTESLTAWAEFNGVEVLDDYPAVLDHDVDIVLSVYYDKILPAKWLKAAPLTLNLHNAPLPRYRGVRPINWALKNGEKMHGVTIHQIEPGIDNGPIYGQVTFPITPSVDEVRDVYARCLEYGYELFCDIFTHIWDITPEPQNENHATYYSADSVKHLWERSGWSREQSMPEVFRRTVELEDDYADYLIDARGE